MENLSSRLLEHLQQVARERNPFFSSQGHFYVREYLRRELGRWGEVDSLSFQYRGFTGENLILDLNRDSSKPPILIGAHYDGVINSPGADDNGTGLAVLLELARYFSQNKANYPIRLVAFDLEEYGLIGSIAYSKKLKGEKQPLRVMLSLEMLGYRDRNPNSQKYPAFLDRFYPNTGDFIALIGNWRTIPDLKRLAAAFRENDTPCEWLPVVLGGYIIPDTRRSDHSPFWSRGYNALMVTDTANSRNPHYHTSRDTIATLDLDFLTRVCHGLSIGIQSLP